MTIEDRLGRLADAAERIAAALEKIAAPQDPALAFRPGTLIGVPVVDGPNYSPLGVRKWHAATWAAEGRPIPKCGTKSLSLLSTPEAVPAQDVPPARRCGSPGCKQAYENTAHIRSPGA